MEHQYKEMDPRTAGNRNQNGHLCQNCQTASSRNINYLGLTSDFTENIRKQIHCVMQKNFVCHGNINIDSIITTAKITPVCNYLRLLKPLRDKKALFGQQPGHTAYSPTRLSCSLP